jgi:cupin fold WbuC family metalloprotein
MIRIITADELGSLGEAAASAPRRRAHLNIHTALDAPVQRLFIATEPDTYMRPHRHPEAHKWEFFVVLAGELHLLIFADTGELTGRIPMSAQAVRAVEIPPGTWHAYVCMRPGTLALEVKEGAYLPTQPQDFGSWSPPESAPEAPDYLAWMRTARPDG